MEGPKASDGSDRDEAAEGALGAGDDHLDDGLAPRPDLVLQVEPL